MRYTLLLLFLLHSLLLYSQVPADKLPPRPSPPTAVNDLAGILNQNEQQQLEQKLRNFNDTASTAIIVVTVQSTGAYEIADYATALGHKWGVGRQDVDNGIVLLVAVNDRKVQIATGYGTEGAVPDAIAKRIVEQIIKPRFRQNDYYGGLEEATSALIAATAGEYSDLATGPAGQRRRLQEEEGVSFIGPLIAIFFIIFFFILPLRAARKAQRRHLSGKKNGCMGPLGTAILLNQMGRRRGRWDDFRGGGGVFGGGFGGGGGGGGGFGGFGGGGFGGGGAGGSW